MVDTYNLIVSVLYYLLVIINRAYAQTYRLPVEVPKNNYAFKFKDLLEKHIRTTQRVQEYADMLRVSRITLNNSVMAQFGVSAIHLLKQRLLEELKNELLFSNLNVSQLADEFHFSDPSHLMRFFKKETGKTFTQYLMNYKRGIYEEKFHIWQMNSIFKIFIFLNNYIFRHKGSFCQSIEIPIAL